MYWEGDTIGAPGKEDFPNDRGATSSDPSEDKPSDTRASRKDRDNLAVGFANQLTHSSGYFVLDADKIKDHTKSVGTYRINACSVGLGSIKFPSMNIGNVPTASTYGTRNPTFHTYDGVNIARHLSASGCPSEESSQAYEVGSALCPCRRNESHTIDPKVDENANSMLLMPQDDAIQSACCKELPRGSLLRGIAQICSLQNPWYENCCKSNFQGQNSAAA